MPLGADYQDAVSFFQRAFTVVLALALSEAFKQAIADKAGQPEDRIIYWERLPTLLSFLLLIFPFFHGMNRHIFRAYLDVKVIPDFYSGFLMLDGIVFMLESAIFFVMSRALSPGQWRNFYWCILALMAIDTIWASLAYLRGAPVVPWIVLNVGLACVSAAVLACFRKPKSLIPPTISAATILITTTLSYIWMWEFYFGKQS
ncbi:hypothetical protein [Bradyrhizobium cosmicum]|uniref:Uncharacterized protein n=1 Tax=Bradyrhizobium cosmicum TaxID=1404864 RepID=A0AAI8MAK5_9BRAD|nr:hypothetical protein [Bradyrhizobium cosmicum]BAL74867.1 hypothetical protein S23_16500 [Bradyrhizobium cosmicum]